MISYLGILCNGLTCSEFHFWKITLAVVWRMDWKVRNIGLKKITLWATGVESELDNNRRDGQEWEDARYIGDSQKNLNTKLALMGRSMNDMVICFDWSNRFADVSNKTLRKIFFVGQLYTRAGAYWVWHFWHKTSR